MRRTLLRVAVLSLLAASACQRKLDGPAPTVSGLSPGAVCTEQRTTSLTLSGDGLSPLVTNGLGATPLLELPKLSLTPSQQLDGSALSGAAVVIPDEPSNPAASHVAWTSQQQMTFAIDPDLQLLPALYGVRVENRNGKTADFPDALLAVPPPTLTSATPDLLCSDLDTDVVLAGQMFVKGAALAPTVAIGQKHYAPASQDGCSALPGGAGLEACTGLTVSVAGGDFAPGAYNLTVTNPETVACSSMEAVTLAVVAPPTLTAVSPDIACAVEGPVQLTLTGTDFIKQGTTLPTVLLGGDMLTPSAASGCTPIAGTTSGAEACTSLTVTVPQGTTPGELDVSVLNPAPAACASAVKKLFLANKPTVTRLEPPGLCTTVTVDTPVDVVGTGFIRVGAALPRVDIGARSYVPTLDGASCVDVTGYSQPLTVCTKLGIVVGASDFAQGDHAVVVDNPAPVAASSTEAVAFSVADPPSLSGVTPARICSNGGTLTLAGTNFTPAMRVTLGTPTPVDASLVTVSSATAASADFGSGLEVGGPYDVSVTTGAACSSTLTAQVTVTAGPVVYFVDPSIVYNGITTQATVYASGFSANGLTVRIRPNGSTTAQTVTSQYNPSKANRILITLPQGLAPGAYDVEVEDALTALCPGTLLNAFTVVDQTTLSLTAIDPPFGTTGAETAVTITADAMTGGGLLALPRFYLNPTTMGALAIPLESVALIDAGRATAVVPAGQQTGTYALIVVNPNGGVGVLNNAFTILPDPTPFIDSVSPVSLVSQAVPMTVAGGNFRTPVVTLLCRDTTGATSTVTPAVTNSTASSIDVNVTAPPTAGSVCVVRVTNGDGSYAEYSAVTFTNPAQNPSAFRPGSALTTPRRALVSMAGSATRAAHFLYAIGGDDGAGTPAPLDTVESAPLDSYGGMGTFTVQRNRLTTPRAFAAGRRIDRWLYVAGGRNASGPLDTVERAYLLDPKDRVDVTDLDYDIQKGTGGLAPGVYSYRVAAVMSGADALNPGGENLPSDPFPVSVPTVTGSALTLTLRWGTVTGAAAYRVYRTVMPGDAAGSEVLLAEVTAPTTSSTDDGTVTPMGLSPLPLGSTGVWTVVGTMPEAREGAAAAWAATSATDRYLYLLGGKSASGTFLNSYAKVPLIASSNGAHTVGSITTDGVNTLSSQRWLCQAQTADAVSAPVVGTSQYVYVMGGATSGGSTGTVQAATVDPGTGTLSGWTPGAGAGTLPTINPNRAGFASAILSGHLHGFGGVTNTTTPDVNGTSTSITTPTPALNNWNSTSIQLGTARYLMGTTQHRAFFYLLGGQGIAAGAQSSTEQIVW